MTYEVHLFCNKDIKNNIMRLVNPKNEDDIMQFVADNRCSTNWLGILPSMLIKDKLSSAMLSSYAAGMFIRCIIGVANGCYIYVSSSENLVPDWFSSLLSQTDIDSIEIKCLDDEKLSGFVVAAEDGSKWQIVSASSKSDAESKFRKENGMIGKAICKCEEIYV